MVNELPPLKDTARYNTTETCKILGICYNTLRDKTERGFIKPIFSGDCKRVYTGKSIKEFFNSLLK